MRGGVHVAQRVELPSLGLLVDGQGGELCLLLRAAALELFAQGPAASLLLDVGAGAHDGLELFERDLAVAVGVSRLG